MTEFRINVVVDPSRADRGARVVERRLVRVENRADQLRQTLFRAFAILGGAALARNAIRTLADFERTLATVRAVSGATADEFQRLRDTAQELGATTRFTATQAGQALLNLSRAGFSVSEALGAVRGTLLLAQAGGLGLSEASDIAASSLRGFRLEVDQTQRVVDVLTLTANSANTSVNQLGEGIKFVAPIAAGLGVDIETASAALGTLSDAGLKASLAGTGLRRVLGGLEAPTEAAEEILREYGLTADDVRVSTNGLLPVLELLASRGVDTAAALDLFGQRGGPAFEVLVNSIPSLRQFSGALLEAGGNAQTAADIIDDTLEGSLRRVQSAYEALILAFGDAGATSALRGLLDSLAGVLRLAAANSELLTTALITLVVAGFNRLLPLLGSAIPALRTFALVAATGSVSLTGLAVAAGRATAALATNPLVLFAVSTAAIISLVRDLRQELRDVEQALKDTEEAAKFNAAGAALTNVRQEIEKITKAVEAQEARGFGASDSQIARLERLRTAEANITGELREQTEESRRVQAAQAANNVTVENSLAALDRRINLLRANRRESELTAAAEDELQRLLERGQVPTKDEQAAIRAKLELIKGLEDQRAALEAIRGPQEDQARQQAALNGLLEAGRITLEEYNKANEKLRADSVEASGLDPFALQVQSLRDSLDVLQARVTLGDREAALVEQQLQLREQLGRDLLPEEVNQLRELITAQADLNDQLRAQGDGGQGGSVFAAKVQALQEQNGLLETQLTLGNEAVQLAQLEQEIRARTGRDITPEQGEQLRTLVAEQRELVAQVEAEAVARRAAAQEAANIARLTQQLDIQGQVLEAERMLNEVLRERPDLANEVGQAMDNVRLRALDASTSLADGFSRAFLRLKQEAEDLASVGEKVVSTFANNATDALTTFVETGEFNFRQFTEALLRDITRIILRLLVVQALNAVAGSTAGGAVVNAGANLAAGGGGARAEGGTVQPGRSFLVGENGPEFFVPDRTGTIVPNQNNVPIEQKAPVINVVNVTDPNEVASAIAGGEADDVIVNVIARNRDKVNQVVS